jgi:hypothetical protein
MDIDASDSGAALSFADSSAVVIVGDRLRTGGASDVVAAGKGASSTIATARVAARGRLAVSRGPEHAASSIASEKNEGRNGGQHPSMPLLDATPADRERFTEITTSSLKRHRPTSRVRPDK